MSGLAETEREEGRKGGRGAYVQDRQSRTEGKTEEGEQLRAYIGSDSELGRRAAAAAAAAAALRLPSLALASYVQLALSTLTANARYTYMSPKFILHIMYVIPSMSS